MPEIICIDLWNCAKASDMEVLGFQKIDKTIKKLHLCLGRKFEVS